MSSTIEPEGPGEKFLSEDDLKSFLERWIAPSLQKVSIRSRKQLLYGV